MDASYRNRLLREATQNPDLVASEERFWKLSWWPHYLRRCDDLLFDDPREGLRFATPAPQLAARIAASHPGANGADLLLLGHSYLGSAYRAIGEHGRAEEAFAKARRYRSSASAPALAEHLRRLACLRIVQHSAECFRLLEEAIDIHKRGNLVCRHALGECLLCRGHAHYQFGEPGKSLADLSAALNHISFKIDDKPWYGAAHNLAGWAVDHGSEQQLTATLANLKAALPFLNTTRRTFAKLKLRWLIALIHARLGEYDRAERIYLKVRDGLVKLELIYEVGMLQVDLAMSYLKQGRLAELGALVEGTAAIFRTSGIQSRAEEAMDHWRQAEEVTEEVLKRVRAKFAAQARPRPAMA